MSDYRLEPDLSQLQPSISRVTPDPIRADSLIVVEGENFLTEAEPTVEAGTPGETTSVLDVEEWGPNYVAVTGGGGFGHAITSDAGPIRITVRNHLGLEASTWATLERPMQRRLYTKFHNHRVQCEVWNSGRDRPSIFCFAGYRRTFRGDAPSCPGWNVVDTSVRIHEEGGSNGYAFLTEPMGPDMDYEIEVWADLFSWIELEVVLEVAGPEGTSCW